MKMATSLCAIVDPFTHYIFGYVLGRRYTADAVKLRAITLAAVLPDIDILSIILGTEAARSFHGTIMHSVFVVPIIAAILALVVWVIWRRNVIAWAVAGVYVHLLLDIVNIPSLAPDVVYNPFRPLVDVNLNPALDPSISFVLWILGFGTLLAIAIIWLIIFTKTGEPPWRIWLDKLWPRRRTE